MLLHPLLSLSVYTVFTPSLQEHLCSSKEVAVGFTDKAFILEHDYTTQHSTIKAHKFFLMFSLFFSMPVISIVLSTPATWAKRLWTDYPGNNSLTCILANPLLLIFHKSLILPASTTLPLSGALWWLLPDARPNTRPPKGVSNGISGYGGWRALFCQYVNGQL